MQSFVSNQIAIIRSSEHYYAFPSLVTLDNGDLLLAFRSGRSCYRDFPEALDLGYHHPHTDYCSEPWLARSTDNGVTWALEPTPRSRREMDRDHADGIGYQDVGFTKLPDGRVMLSVFRWKYSNEAPPDDLASPVRQEALLEHRAPNSTYDYSRYQPYRYAYRIPPVYSICDVTGRNWAKFKEIDVPEPTTGKRWGLAARNGGVVLDDDALGMPFYCEPDSGTQEISGCHLLRYCISRDQWSYGNQMAAGSEELPMEEHMIHRAPDGRLLGFYRCTKAGYMFYNESHDNGESWSDLVRTNVWGHPFTALTVNDSDVLLAYGYRRPPFGIRMTLLTNGDVHSFDPEDEIVVRDDGRDDDTGYPTMCLTDDRMIVLAYYYMTKDDRGHQARYIAIERHPLEDLPY